MIRVILASTVLALASCAPTGQPAATRAAVAEAVATLPAPRRFTGPPGLDSPIPANGQLARDFLALSFRLETGRDVPTFTRFEGPVTIAVEGDAPASLHGDLDELIDRLRREARIDVSRAAPGERGAITIAALPRSQLQRQVPGAACFVVPRVSGWRDYLANRFGDTTDWTTLTTRTRASVFLPSDVSAQEIRDCLHEEVAQALGPLNDLHRLAHSVFNDDNVHVVLTPFDMAILRATYDPALRSGMTEAQVAAALPAVLARTNPAGRRADGAAVAESDPDWTTAISDAITPGGSDNVRLRQAGRAVALARAAGWEDERLAFSLLAQGRAALASDGDLAIASFLDSAALYDRLTGDGIHSAQVALQLGALAVSTGRPDAALAILDRAIPAAGDAQNAALLATLLLLRAEAASMQGARAEANRTRREGLAWGRYAWGDEVLVRRAAEVAALGPGT
ncbi:MAG: DUF2927 domain-containing protein [Pseudomonadota bacterium]